MSKRIADPYNKKSEYQTKRIPITVTKDEYEELAQIAASESLPTATLCRKYVMQGKNPKVTEENLTLITTIMREQMKNILDPLFNRSIALNAKALKYSMASSYLSAEVIGKFVPEDKRQDFIEVYNKAMKRAAKEMNIRDEEL